MNHNTNRVVLAGFNARYSHTAAALYCLRATLQKAGIQPQLLQFTTSQPVWEILEALQKAQPDVLGISVYIWNIELVKKLLPELPKLLPATRVVLGGPEMYHQPEDWQRNYPAVKQVVVGPGEGVIAGIISQDVNDPVVYGTAIPLADLPCPYLPNDDFTNRYVYYESSRGCPYGCSFCLSAHDQGVSYRPLSLVLPELEMLKNSHPLAVKFVDRTFNSCPDHYRPIWEYILEHGAGCLWHCELRPDLLTDDDFALLQKFPTGRMQLEIGLQSTNPEALQACNRAINMELALENCRRLIALKRFHVHLDLIAGLPADGIDEVAAGFDALHNLEPDYLQLGFLKLLPGTPLHNDKHRWGIVAQDNPPYTVLKHDKIDFATLARLHRVEEMVDRLYNPGKIKETLTLLCSGGSLAFYDNLAGWMKEKGVRPSGDLNTTAILLLDWCRAQKPERLPALTDCLRWDWAACTPWCGWPSALKPPSVPVDIAARLRLYLNKNNLPADQRGLLFVPQSREICQRLLPRQAIFFYTDGSIFL